MKATTFLRAGLVTAIIFQISETPVYCQDNATTSPAELLMEVHIPVHYSVAQGAFSSSGRDYLGVGAWSACLIDLEQADYHLMGVPSRSSLISAIALSSDKTFALIGYADLAVVRYSISTPLVASELRSPVLSEDPLLARSPYSEWLYCYDVRLFDADTQFAAAGDRAVHIGTAHRSLHHETDAQQESMIIAIGINEGDGTVTTASLDGHIRRWDLETGGMLSDWEVGAPCILSRDGSTAVLAAETPASYKYGPARICVLGIEDRSVTLDEEMPLQGSSCDILYHCRLSATGHRLAVYHENTYEIWIYDVAANRGAKCADLSGWKNTGLAIEISPDGDLVAVTALGAVPNIRIFDCSGVLRKALVTSAKISLENQEAR